MRMKGGDKQSQGFTIVEVLIVFAIAAFLLASAIILVNGSQNQTQFNTSYQNTSSQVQEIINEIQSGYYPSHNDFVCTGDSSSGIQITTNFTAQQGQNVDCTFMGKGLVFYPIGGAGTDNTNINQFSVYTIAGLQCASGSNATNDCTPVASIAAAQPIAIDRDIAGQNSGTDVPQNVTQTVPLGGGVQVYSAYYNNNPANSACGVSIIASPTPGASDQLISGGQQLVFNPILYYSHTCNGRYAVESMRISLADPGPVNNFEVCLQSIATNQSTLLTLDAGAQLTNGAQTNGSFASGQVSVSTKVYENKTCT